MKPLIGLVALTASLFTSSHLMAEATYEIRVPFDTRSASATAPEEENALPASCKDILHAGESTGDGIYTLTINETEAPVYCDMTRDGGGWTLVAHWIAPAGRRGYGDLIVSGYPIKSFSQNTNIYPALPAGVDNTFNEALYSGGGTAAWNNKFTRWFTHPVLNESQLPIKEGGLPIVKSDGSSGFVYSISGWPNPAGILPHTTFGYSDAWGISPTCGGAGAARGPNCPIMMDGYDNSHFDHATTKFLFLR